MIYPIVAYGDSVLRKKAVDISVDYPNLKQLVDDMFETMKSSSGVGLAAPQIGLSIRLFLVDSIAILESYAEDDENDFEGEVGIRKAFFNAKIIQRAGDPWQYNEGCLSIPKIREDILRPEEIVIEYQDENFKTVTETYSGLNARIIQHEFDHIEGILFVDYLKPLKKQLLRKKLEAISKGEVKVDYKMKFPLKK